MEQGIPTTIPVTEPVVVDTGLVATMGGLWFIWMVVTVVMIVALWKIFVKAGKPGWASIIPIYNIIVLLEIVGRPTWWVLLYLLSIIPFVGWIAALVVSIIVTIDLAKSFGKTTGFAVLMILLPVVGYPILAFGEDKYVGAVTSTKNDSKKSDQA